MPDDIELLRQYVSDHSEGAFTTLVHKRLGMVYGIALRQTRDADLAAEVAQEVFAALARKAPALVQRPVLASWLYRSAQFAASEAMRNKGRRQRREQEILTMMDSPADPSPSNWEKIRPMLDEVIGKLASRDRDAVVLRFTDAKSYSEVAVHLHLSENAARMRVERALDKLRSALKRRGIDSTFAAVALALSSEASATVPAGLANAMSKGALASAASITGPSALAVFKIMSTVKITSVLGLVAIAAAGTAVYEARTLHTSVAALARVTKERDLLQSQLRAQEIVRRRQPSESIGAKLQLVADRAAALRTAHAQAKESNIDQARLAKYHQRYDRFVRQQGLTPAQADKLFDILGQWDDVSRDFQAAIREQGLTATPVAQKLRDQLQHEIEVDPLQNLLGPDGEQAYMAYEGNSFFQTVLDPITQELERSNEPLSDGQLAKVLALVRSNMHQAKPDPTSMSSQAVFDWDTIVASAGGFLSPTQVTAMQGTIARIYKHQ